MRLTSLLSLSSLVWLSSGFIIPQRCCYKNAKPVVHHPRLLHQATRDKESQTRNREDSILDLEEPAGVVGAEFFGGNKQKEEFYDPVAEEQADKDFEKTSMVYERFQDTNAFESQRVAQIAQALQKQVNSLLYNEKQDQEDIMDLQYASRLGWDSCFDTKSSKNPLAALKEAMDFFPRVDVAIIAGKQVDKDRMKLLWQIAVEWPIFWEPRVFLTGYSDLTVQDDNTITKQVDTLDSSSDMLSTIGAQLQPRFWDMFHIGMSPSAELLPRVQQGGLLPKSYSLFEIPARLVTAPSQLDSEAGREDGTAQIVPNHAFSCVIKTMGPKKQRFVPASPVEVQILPNGQGNPPMLKWSVPLSVEFQTQFQLPIPGEDSEAPLGSEPECRYEFQARRRVATVPYGGTPQDVEIADIRKKLYEQVMKDGLKPKLDDAGRPQFFFLQNGVKACYTEEGLGMCVYEWRPDFVKPHEVGIELELSC